jgi:hypothetical protein
VEEKVGFLRNIVGMGFKGRTYMDCIGIRKEPPVILVEADEGMTVEIAPDL